MIARPGSTARNLRAGHMVRLDRRPFPQFVYPIKFRVIRILDRPTYDGWLWLEGYELDASGDALRKRQLFVKTEAVQPQNPAFIDVILRPTVEGCPLPAVSDPDARPSPPDTPARSCWCFGMDARRPPHYRSHHAGLNLTTGGGRVPPGCSYSVGAGVV